MPELPEVQTIVLYLASHLVGKKISSVEILKPKSFVGKKEEIIGTVIKKVERRAKLIVISLSNNKTLLIHLKMSGQLIYESRITNNELNKNKYKRVVINFTDKSQLIFNDLRIFGWIKVINSLKVQGFNGLKLGPEPFSKEFTVEYLQKVFSKTRRPIKLVLMDQEKIAGIGNIYANEILFDAGIRPDKPAQQLNNLTIKQLRNSILKILKKAIKYKGSSAADEQYIQANGEKGSYQKHFLVYQRDGEKCKRCGGEVKRTKLGGRGTFWCPKCQK